MLIQKPTPRELTLSYRTPYATNDLDSEIEAAWLRNRFFVSASDFTNATIDRLGNGRVSREDRNRIFKAVLDAILDNSWELEMAKMKAREIA